MDKKAALEATLSRVCGFPVEVTVRGDREFTLSAEGKRDFQKARTFFKVKGETNYDAEADLTCFYFAVA